MEPLAAQSDSSPWSWRKLSVLALFLVLLKGALLFTLVDRAPVIVRQADPFPLMHLGSRPAPGVEAGPVIILEDPTVFALPHPKGFSGPAWFGKAETPLALAEIQSAPKFLESDKGLLFSVSASVQQQLTPSPAGQSEPLAAAEPLRAAESRTGQTNTIVYPVGALEGRTLAAPLPAPAQRHPELLSNTVVELGVDQEGIPRMARLASSSGARGADLQALQLALQARFNPVAPPHEQPVINGLDALHQGLARPELPLEWGALVYQWLTLPPKTTNAPPVK